MFRIVTVARKGISNKLIQQSLHRGLRVNYKFVYTFSEPKKETVNEGIKENANNEYQKNFEKLQEKINDNKTDSQIKAETVKNIFVNAKKYVDDGINSLFTRKGNTDKGKQQEDSTKNQESPVKPDSARDNVKTDQAENNNKANQAKDNVKAADQANENTAGNSKEETNTKQDAKYESSANEGAKEEAPKVEKKAKMDVLKEKMPKVHKAVSFAKYAWDLTFPDEKYKAKFEKNKEKWAEQRLEEEKRANLTEEELKKMEESVPEWKKNAMQVSGTTQEKEGIKDRLKNKVRVKFNQTDFAKSIYTSDKYKEFEQFKREMAQFKEDVKDQVENSQSRVVQTSLNLYSKATNESSVAKAVREMRKLQPDFDIWELEDDAKGIFEAAYTTYLQGNLTLLEKMCGEMALGYFKVLLKKREIEKSEPKYKYLWNIERAFFSGASIPEKRLPVFMFTIQTQKIYCNISTVDKRIIDGDDEILMRYEFSFALTPHSAPDVEEVGHMWEIIEIQPKEVLKLLV